MLLTARTLTKWLWNAPSVLLWAAQYKWPLLLLLTDVQIVHKLAASVTLNLDFKVTLFFNVSKTVGLQDERYIEAVVTWICISALLWLAKRSVVDHTLSPANNTIYLPSVNQMAPPLIVMADI